MKREWAKIEWCMFRNEGVVALERNLALHMMTVNMYCGNCGGRLSFR